MTIERETRCCAEKRKKAGGTLRYILIGALELAKSAREAQAAGAIKGRKRKHAKIGESPEGFLKSFFLDIF